MTLDISEKSQEWQDGYRAGRANALAETILEALKPDFIPSGESSMVFLPGSEKSFHCECACNVFGKGTDSKGRDLFRCNACGNIYEGVPRA